jgi:hypothetical protein
MVIVGSNMCLNHALLGNIWVVNYLFGKRSKKTKVNIDHVYLYYEIGIWKYEFGAENKWKRHHTTDGCKQGLPVKRMSFVHTNNNKEREGLVGSIQFFFMSMKKRDDNSIGPLILKDLKKTAEGLIRDLMKGDNKSEEYFTQKTTQDINEHFSSRYNIIWNDTLNHFLVNFDII